MKTVNYRGGLLQFRIPTHWVEEYEDDGGGTFYEDNPDSPTLRFNVLTFESPSPIHQNTPAEMLGSRAEKTGKDVVHLNGGNAMVAYSEPAEEHGEPLLIYYWELANAAPPQTTRLAIFTLTIMKSQQIDPEIVKTIEMVDRELRSCRFAPELGFGTARN